MRAFEATDHYYGAFIELFDCHYGVSFTGSSGGPLLNRNGKVEGVFSSTIRSSLPGCDFIVAGKGNLSTEDLKATIETQNSTEEIKELMNLEKAHQVEHPFIHSNFVIVPQNEDIIHCNFTPHSRP